MKKKLLAILVSSSLLLGACSDNSSTTSTSTAPSAVAPGAPGNAAVWSYAGKTGIGTSYEQYTDGAYKDTGATGTISKVWFSIAQGVLTETMYGLIHEAQLQELQFFVKGDGFLDEEKKDTISTVEYLITDDQGRPQSLAYKIVNRDKEGKYEIEKHIFTDPDSQTLMMRVQFRALTADVTPYVYVNPSIANTGSNDSARSVDGVWIATDGDTSMTVKTTAQVTQSTVGFEGVSDGIADLKQHGALTQAYNTTGDSKGNVAMTLQLAEVKSGASTQWDLVLGFGKTPTDSTAAAEQTLAKGYDKVLAHYNGDGDAIGWRDFLQTLPALEKLSATATDGGKLAYTSAMVLKAQEDKTHAGAFIASLSNPWGDTKSAEKSATGYKAVWPRDFYQVAMAMLALGDRESPRIAFEYLEKIQASDKIAGYSGTPGWFLQKTHVDGEVEWVGVQLDQTGMPLMLGWRLWKEGIFSDAEITQWYNTMLKPAADFLVNGGQVKILWNDTTIKPPYTQQERWEEQQGYSPSTTAAIIAGLVSAADIATQAGDTEGAAKYLAAADKYSSELEAKTFTTNGSLTGDLGNGQYYLRINANEDPNDRSALGTSNAQVINDESQVIDGGFLELVRYGVRAATDKHVLETIPEYDNLKLPDLLRTKYEFTFPGVEGTFPGWRRYGIDGYGEEITAGKGYVEANNSTDGRGRVWPFFTGERGHYELELAKANASVDINALRNTYVKAMELFANEGMMLPEQVWDGVGNNDTYNYRLGQGTNGATPLAWTHAEYIKLLRSYSDGKVWDRNDSTEARYVK
ncbi:glucan 1,4-alpha-glucosidase [Cellvibrio sp. PSBB023]|uniref:glucan 1,4-alpha-glucosidase n=1 Tax=Cellvibrio sp. PSBB023 TaxID=1945512 RepID=UPI00098FE9BD|nr:glucan 1,4-alpha-glucosidase [Cellvibrio sp. PSBB023]AQT61805.1 glucan 1,4-alpha-glucosidase [Cellvibrio sp. PSBB023]